MRRTSPPAAKPDRRTIDPGRQALYQVGLVMQVIGGVGFLIGFVSFALSGLSAVESTGREGDPFAWWFVCLGSMVLIGVGGGIRTIAARGVAGAGLVLDPERARRDLEPWSRMGGGMLKDALAGAERDDADGAADPETALAGPPADSGSAVKIRCRRCKALSPEDTKYCGQCGAEL